MQLPFTPQLPVRTDRLILREFRPGDVDALLPFHSDPGNVLYVPFNARTPEEMQVALERKIAGTSIAADGDHLDLAVTLQDGTLVGDLVTFVHALEHGTVEVGWIFDPAHGGRGYATEAVRAMLHLVFTGLQARRAVARVDERNTASRRLCERLGMRQEAHLVENEVFKGGLSSEIDFALLSREWPATATQSV
ncbi:MAG: GNAT family N-acetyltransferase [Frankiaceae bacterium]|nr:GNAT family N-acetyltransferase [Frankiaceae bacterium]